MHNHDHGHHHHGGHDHGVSPTIGHKAFIAGIVLNTIYVAVQATAGFMMDSMALLSDAGHNLSDVASLGLSYLALRLSRSKPTASFTYGYKKTTILAALTNGVALFIAIGMLAYGSIQRLLHPHPVEGGGVAIVAAIGIVVNFGSAMFFFRDKDHDLNTKGAYLHLLTDALVSLGVVIAGLAMKYTGWYWLDGGISLVILVVIFISTWSLLTASLRLTLDAVPKNIDPEKVIVSIMKMQGVEDIHHVHIWAMSTTENALTAHLIASSELTFEEKLALVQRVKHELLHQRIQHATIELENSPTPGQEQCDVSG